MRKAVGPIHFEDFSGAEFERLVFAYHLRDGWQKLAWYGELGSDLGRDIIGVQVEDGQPDRLSIIQCVNRSKLTKAKAERDIRKAVSAPTGTPEAFIFVCRSGVSAPLRDHLQKYGRQRGVRVTTAMSGSEFEENLRLKAEFLLQRFVNGEPFPDSPAQLRKFADEFPDMSDDDAIHLMGRAFDRAAFRTPFYEETNLPAFLRAIEDTIRVLNTGIWQTRDDVEIRRLPSMHMLRDAGKRKILQRVSSALENLRRTFKRGLNSKEIRHCLAGIRSAQLL
jgi:hypothetical protein